MQDRMYPIAGEESEPEEELREQRPAPIYTEHGTRRENSRLNIHIYTYRHGEAQAKHKHTQVLEFIVFQQRIQ